METSCWLDNEWINQQWFEEPLRVIDMVKYPRRLGILVHFRITGMIGAVWGERAGVWDAV